MISIEKTLEERRRMRSMDVALEQLRDRTRNLSRQVLHDEPGRYCRIEALLVWRNWGYFNTAVAEYFCAITDTSSMEEAQRVIKIWEDQARADGMFHDIE